MSSVIAFTGIPGTGVQTAVAELASSLPSARRICVDEYLWDAFAAEARENSTLLGATDLSIDAVSRGGRPDWWQLLKLPAPKIRQYWSRAAERALEETMTANEDIVLVSFHAVFHSDDYRWRFSAVDLQLLPKFGFDGFFCLIDDIYEIQARRPAELAAERGEIRGFEDPVERAVELVRSTVERLEQFIAWRQEEIVFTDHFAALCGAPSHVLAVNHPISTAEQLVENPTLSFYFSHPITAIRKVQGFVDGAEYRAVADCSRRIRSTAPIIEPTTIDELRIGKIPVRRPKDPDGERTWAFFGDGDDEEEKEWEVRDLALPILNERWPVSSGLLLAGPGGEPRATNSEPESICAQVNISELGLSDHFQKLATAPEELGLAHLEGLSRLVGPLVARIAEDITWRDHHLVHQTRNLIVYRPVGYGYRSSGVQREVEYFGKLVQTGVERTGKAIVCHPVEDAELEAAGVAKTLLEDLEKDKKLSAAFRHPMADVREGLEADITKAILESEDLSELVEEVRRLVDAGLELEPRIPKRFPMKEGPGAAQRILRRPLKDLRDDLVERTLKGGLYLRRWAPILKESFELSDTENKLMTILRETLAKMKQRSADAGS